MARTTRYTLLPLVARTVSGASGWQDFYHDEELLVFLNITAFSGTSPTLNVRIEVRDPDGAIYDLPDGTFTQQIGAARIARGFRCFGEQLRVNFVIGGTATPSFTFGVTAIGKASQ